MGEKIKLTKTTVEKLPFAEKGTQVDYYDSKLPAFGVRVSATSKVYFVRKRINGKNSRVNIGKHGIKTADEARAEAITALSDLGKGKDINQGKKDARAKGKTLDDISGLFFEARELKPKTETFYQIMLDVHLKEWKKTPLKDITSEMVAKKHLKIGKSSGKVTANNAMKTLRAIYNFALAKFPGSLPENPVKVLSHSRQWNKVQRRKTCLKKHELPVWYQAVNALSNPIIRDFFKFLLFTGLRKDEALCLKWENVDFEGKTFTVIDTKNHNPHALPLTDYLVGLLEERKKLRENDFVFPGSGKSGHLYEPRKQIAVIERETCKILNSVTDDAELEKLMEENPDKVKPGITFMPHDLRRTFATVAEQVVSYSELKRLLNHSTEDDVTQGYLVITVEKLREPMQRVTDVLLSAIEPKAPETPEKPKEPKNNVIPFRRAIAE
jgi:integrase